MKNDELLEKCRDFVQQLREQWSRARNENGADIVYEQIIVKEVSPNGFHELLMGIDELVQKSGVQIDQNILLVDCSFLVFKEKLSFPNFDYGISFKKSEFKREVELKGKVIKGSVDFSEAIFADKADFSHSHFYKTLNLNAAVFPQRDLTGKENFLVADFSWTKFEKDLILQNAIFQGDAHFRHAKFLGDTNFIRIGFPPPAIADFSNACFEKKLLFHPRNFGQEAGGKENQYIFEEGDFKSSAVFEATLNNVEFSKAKFFETASFGGCSFYGIAKFNGTSFGKFADFRSANKAKMEFKEACFNGKTEFFGNSQPVVMDFTKAYFAQAPHFREGGLHPNTKIRKAQFAGFATEDDYQNYRILKRECARIHAREEENIFHYCEMRTLAWLYISHPRSIFLGIISYLYFCISRYGQGPFQALFVLVGLMAIFSCIYANYPVDIILHQGASIEWAKGINTGILYTVQNIVYPFSQFGQKGIIEAKTGALAVLGVFQSLTFFTIFGLFILAVRRRFRKGSE